MKKGNAIAIIVVIGVAAAVGIYFLLYKEPVVLYGTGSGPLDLDPVNSWDSASVDVQDQVLEGLYKYDLANSPFPMIPCLATDMGSWSVDNLNFTVNLRTGVTFHDGSAFNATVVKWNFDRLAYFMNISGTLPGDVMETIIKPIYMYNNQPVINHTEIINNTAVKFVLNFPYGPFQSTLCFSAAYMLSMVATPATAYISTATGKIVGTGPYVYDGYIANTEVDFHRWDNYWGSKAKIRLLKFVVIEDPITRNQGLISGAFNFLQDPLPSMFSQFNSSVGCKLIDTHTDNMITQYLGMNNNFINKTFRHAISYAFNYSYLTDIIMQGQASRLLSPIPMGVMYANNTLNVPIYNVTKAREIMVSMGFGSMGWTNQQWIDQATVGTPFATYNYTYNTDNQIRVDIGSLVKANCEAIGVKVDLTGMTWADFKKRFNEVDPYNHDNLQLFWIGWIMDYNEPSNFINPLFQNVSSSNIAQVNDALLESEMNAAIIETNPVIRAQEYNEIQRYIVEDLMPWVLGYVGKNFDASANNLAGFPSNPMGRVWFADCYFT